MAYIIENANILKNNQLVQCSILVKDDLIAGLKHKYNHYNYMKMNAEPYVMTPTYCLLDTNISQKGNFQDLRNYISNQFLLKGCTTFLTYVNISFEYQIEEKLKELKMALINCPIDFMIGIKIPLKLITPSVVRKCKKEKISALFVEITDPGKLEDVPWGWIRDALFPYNCPLIPVVSSSLKEEVKTGLSKWKHVLEKEKIPAIHEELAEGQPLPVEILNKIGVFPRKSSLMQGTELSYNLYLMEKEYSQVDEKSLFHYHMDRLVVTVHRGKVIRSGSNVLFKPGNGEYVKAKTPAFFSL